MEGVGCLRFSIHREGVIGGSSDFTGRTHQIRKHMLAQGTPILGDDLYTIGNPLRKKGLFLAATQIRFVHPITKTPISISVPTPKKFLQRIAFEHDYLLNKGG